MRIREIHLEECKFNGQIWTMETSLREELSTEDHQKVERLSYLAAQGTLTKARERQVKNTTG